MIHTDYKVEALAFLLDKSCLSERFYPLTDYRDSLLSEAKSLGCKTKNDVQSLSDAQLESIGLPDADTVLLFRRFLSLYDVKPQKFRELDGAALNDEEKRAYEQLYHLPGVKRIRAQLYYRSGYCSLAAVAAADEKEILGKTARTIAENGMTCIVPLPKEVRTHIAVAKAFTME